jgi:hypothetical protein
MAQDSDGGGSGWDQATNSTQDLGPNPGSLGALGMPSYGTIGSALGGLVGMATGVPGLGSLGGFAGGYLDAENMNGMLSAAGLAPSINSRDAAFSAATPFGGFGVFGLSAEEQMYGALGLPAPGTPFGMPGHEVGEDPAAAAAAAEQAAMTAGQPSPGFGGTYGYGTDPANGIGSGDFGAASAAGRGETVGPDNSYGGYGGGYGGGSEGGGMGGSSDSASDGPGAGGGVGADGGVGSGGDAWMSGGYTGAGQDGAVQPAQPAGTVHEGEVVIPARMVQHYGLPLLMGLVDGSVPRSRLAELAGV